MKIPTSALGMALILALAGGLRLSSPGEGQQLGYLHTDGNRLVDAWDRPVVLTGVNWFGLETPNYAPHGLWARNWESVLDQMVGLGFNAIRLPYSNQLFDPESVPNGIDYQLNADLQGLTGLEIMDRIIAGAGVRGLKVILDRHRPDSSAQSELWYTPAYDEARWIDDWVMLAERYRGNDTVIGADLHNEPHGRATWGSGDPATDWRLAAERGGNAILAVNPDWLILVQGVDQYEAEWYWWGGNLMGVRDHPVRLDIPSQLVYSPHVYGPQVYPQPWFWEPSFPANLDGIWYRHWAFVHYERVAPVVVGEFGGRSVGDDREGVWQRRLVEYLRQNELSYFYWTVNPNSGDTGGILLDDWQTVDAEKLALLSTHQFPRLGSLPTPDATERPVVGALDLAPGSLQVLYRTLAPTEWSKESKPEFIIVNAGTAPIQLAHLELVYWLQSSEAELLQFHCDWAAIGCAKLQAEFVEESDGFVGLRLSFAADAGQLEPMRDSGEIKARFHRSDWSEYLQTDDLSFGTAAEFEAWPHLTLYLDGELVWGTEPEPQATSGSTVVQVADPAKDQPTDVAADESSQRLQTPEERSTVSWLPVASGAILALGLLLGGLLARSVRRGS